MERFRVYGASTKGETQRERDHRALARRAAAEGMVLLKNDGVLPFKTRTVALYGAGARMTVKGGTGSGEVEERYSVTIEQGLRNGGFTIPNTLWMDRFDSKFQRNQMLWRMDVEDKIKGYGPIRTMQMFDIIHSHPMPYPSAAPIHDDELTDETDTAIYVVARQAGEGGDRRAEKGDYYLSDIETESIKTLAAHYKHLVLVINCGCVMDLSILDEVEINAVLYYSQGGMEGGNAFADVVSGKETPSGKLTDTWGYSYSDYPSADTFSYLSGDMTHNDYREGIYVGYRWFEAEGKRPRYPFGFGLSYTKFSTQAEDTKVEGTRVTVTAEVKNTGDTFSGKEVIQLYLAKPGGPLDHERKGLVAFGKTGLLLPGGREHLTLTFDMAEQGAFDEARSAFVLEPGEYGLLLGSSAENAQPVAVLTLDAEIILEETGHICPQKKQFCAYIHHAAPIQYEAALPRLALNAADFTLLRHSYQQAEPQLSPKLREKLGTLNAKDLISLCVGGGYSMRGFTNVPGVVGTTSVQLLKKGIPNVTLSDGPAGLRVMQTGAVQKNGLVLYPEGLPKDWEWGYLKHLAPLVQTKRGRLVYHYMSAFPCETMQAQTWNRALLEEIGQAVGREMAEIGVTVWLAPGINLHRNPLCGRNFEYYSEDPVLTGKMAAAITRGVQSVPGCGVSVKHFCCNSQEENRDHMSSNLSERTLREMYLRAFRIAVQEGRPWTVMTSYNMVNDVYTPNSHDLCTKVLRCEWGFEGLVMSDWNSTDKCSHAAAINAGNDLIMPGNSGVRKALTAALKAGELDKAALRRSAGRVLKLIFDSTVAEGF
ncbi:MAG: glycoside hydrolase family 3 C-terminal domain-containing protein [Ruminococcus flavefaciens]|nr:glycoside hydrolase family 3 C-terminal domain-containing protein [Ruminococcus flavefaciens]